MILKIYCFSATGGMHRQRLSSQYRSFQVCGPTSGKARLATDGTFRRLYWTLVWQRDRRPGRSATRL